MRLVLAVCLGICACHTAAPLEGSGALDGGATLDTGASKGLNADPKRFCPDYELPTAGRLCRSQADCDADPNVRDATCMLSTTRFNLPPCASGVQPPPAECGRDLDCPPGHECRNQYPGCPQYFSKCVVSSCTPASCGQGARCRTDGRCEALSCTDGSWTCGTDLKCSTDPMAPSRDANGCVPLPCTEGYACPAGQLCADGYQVDAHGCRPRTCAEGIACPTWQRCQMNPQVLPVAYCEARPCKVDRDCPCGICLNAQFCAPGPGLCLGFPSLPP